MAHTTHNGQGIFHQHPTAVNANTFVGGYGLGQVQSKDLELAGVVGMKESSGTSSAPAATNAWHHSRMRYSSTGTAGVAPRGFLPYQMSSLPRYDGQSVDTTHLAHGSHHQPFWVGNPNAYSLMGSSYQREHNTYAERADTSRSTTALRHSSAMANRNYAVEDQSRNVNASLQQQPAVGQVLPQHCQRQSRQSMHQLQQHQQLHHQQDYLRNQMSQRERDPCQYAGNYHQEGMLYHDQHIPQQHHQQYTPEALRKASESDRRTAFASASARQAWPQTWPKSAYVPFETPQAFLSNHHSTGSAFQPLKQTDSDPYSMDSIWAKSAVPTPPSHVAHAPSHSSSNHMPLATQTWLHDSSHLKSNVYRQDMNQVTQNVPSNFSTNVLNLDTGKVELSMSAVPHELSLYPQAVPQSQRHPTQHPASVPPQPTLPAQQVPQNHMKLVAKDPPKAAEAAKPSSTARAAGLDVRQFLATWDEDLDLATPRPAIVEEEPEQPSLVVLDYQTVPSEEAAGLLQLYPGLQLSGSDPVVLLDNPNGKSNLDFVLSRAVATGSSVQVSQPSAMNIVPATTEKPLLDSNSQASPSDAKSNTNVENALEEPRSQEPTTPASLCESDSEKGKKSSLRMFRKRKAIGESDASSQGSETVDEVPAKASKSDEYNSLTNWFGNDSMDTIDGPIRTPVSVSSAAYDSAAQSPADTKESEQKSVSVITLNHHVTTGRSMPDISDDAMFGNPKQDRGGSREGADREPNEKPEPLRSPGQPEMTAHATEPFEPEECSDMINSYDDRRGLRSCGQESMSADRESNRSEKLDSKQNEDPRDASYREFCDLIDQEFRNYACRKIPDQEAQDLSDPVRQDELPQDLCSVVRSDREPNSDEESPHVAEQEPPEKSEGEIPDRGNFEREPRDIADQNPDEVAPENPRQNSEQEPRSIFDGDSQESGDITKEPPNICVRTPDREPDDTYAEPQVTDREPRSFFNWEPRVFDREPSALQERSLSNTETQHLAAPLDTPGEQYDNITDWDSMKPFRRRLSSSQESSENKDSEDVMDLSRHFTDETQLKETFPTREVGPIKSPDVSPRGASEETQETTKYLSRIVGSAPGKIPKILLSRLKDVRENRRKNGVVRKLPCIRLRRIQSRTPVSGDEPPEYECREKENLPADYSVRESQVGDFGKSRDSSVTGSEPVSRDIYSCATDCRDGDDSANLENDRTSGNSQSGDYSEERTQGGDSLANHDQGRDLSIGRDFSSEISRGGESPVEHNQDGDVTTRGDFPAKLSDDEDFCLKSNQDGDLNMSRTKLSRDGDFSAEHIRDRDFSAEYNPNGELKGGIKDEDCAEKLSGSGDSSEKLSGDGGFVDKCNQDRDLTTRIGGGGDFSATLSGDGDFPKKYRQDGDLTRASGDGDFSAKLSRSEDFPSQYQDGNSTRISRGADLSPIYNQNRDFTTELGGGGDFENNQVEDLTTEASRDGDVCETQDGNPTKFNHEDSTMEVWRDRLFSADDNLNVNFSSKNNQIGDLSANDEQIKDLSVKDFQSDNLSVEHSREDVPVEVSQCRVLPEESCPEKELSAGNENLRVKHSQSINLPADVGEDGVPSVKDNEIEELSAKDDQTEDLFAKENQIRDLSGIDCLSGEDGINDERKTDTLDIESCIRRDSGNRSVTASPVLQKIEEYLDCSPKTSPQRRSVNETRDLKSPQFEDPGTPPGIKYPETFKSSSPSQYEEGEIIDEESQIMEEESNLLNEEGKVLDEGGEIQDDKEILHADRDILIAETKISDEEDKILDEDREILGEEGEIFDPSSRPATPVSPFEKRMSSALSFRNKSPDLSENLDFPGPDLSLRFPNAGQSPPKHVFKLRSPPVRIRSNGSNWEDETEIQREEKNEKSGWTDDDSCGSPRPFEQHRKTEEEKNVDWDESTNDSVTSAPPKTSDVVSKSEEDPRSRQIRTSSSRSSRKSSSSEDDSSDSSSSGFSRTSSSESSSSESSSSSDEDSSDDSASSELDSSEEMPSEEVSRSPDDIPKEDSKSDEKTSDELPSANVSVGEPDVAETADSDFSEPHVCELPSVNTDTPIDAESLPEESANTDVEMTVEVSPNAEAPHPDDIPFLGNSDVEITASCDSAGVQSDSELVVEKVTSDVVESSLKSAPSVEGEAVLEGSVVEIADETIGTSCIPFLESNAEETTQQFESFSVKNVADAQALDNETSLDKTCEAINPECESVNNVEEAQPIDGLVSETASIGVEMAPEGELVSEESPNIDTAPLSESSSVLVSESSREKDVDVQRLDAERPISDVEITLDCVSANVDAQMDDEPVLEKTETLSAPAISTETEVEKSVVPINSNAVTAEPSEGEPYLEASPENTSVVPINGNSVTAEPSEGDTCLSESENACAHTEKTEGTEQLELVGGTEVFVEEDTLLVFTDAETGDVLVEGEDGCLQVENGEEYLVVDEDQYSGLCGVAMDMETFAMENIEEVPTGEEAQHGQGDFYCDEISSAPVEEVVSCEIEEVSETLPQENPLQVRCSLSWERILNEGQGLVLGPANVEVPQPGEEPRRSHWKVVTRERKRASRSKKVEENNNLMPDVKSPVVMVKRLLLKRPRTRSRKCDRLEWEQTPKITPLKTKAALKAFQAQTDLVQRSRHRSWPAATDAKRKSGMRRRRSELSPPADNWSCSSPQRLPKVIIKRTGEGPQYQSFICEKDVQVMQPVVKIERNTELDNLAMTMWSAVASPTSSAGESHENETKEPEGADEKRGKRKRRTGQLMKVVELLQQWRQDEAAKAEGENLEPEVENNNSILCFDNNDDIYLCQFHSAESFSSDSAESCATNSYDVDTVTQDGNKTKEDSEQDSITQQNELSQDVVQENIVEEIVETGTQVENSLRESIVEDTIQREAVLQEEIVETSTFQRDDGVECTSTQGHSPMKDSTNVLREVVVVREADSVLQEDECRDEVHKDVVSFTENEIVEERVVEESPQQSRRTSIEDELGLPLICQVCGFTTLRLEEQASHIKTHSYHCQRCQLAFTTQVSYYNCVLNILFNI